MTMLPSEEARVGSIEDLRGILARISFENSVLNFAWQFEVQEMDAHYKGPVSFFDATRNQTVHADNPTRRGYLLWASFSRPDANTGEVGRGRGRDEIVWDGWTESAVVKTAYVVVQMLIQHELMEAIKFDRHRFFDPHNSIAELNSLQIAKGR